MNNAILDLDPKNADIRYLSSAKLQGFNLEPQHGGYNGGILGASFGTSSKSKSNRHLLSEAYRTMQKQGSIGYVSPPSPGGYLLTRMIGFCCVFESNYRGRLPHLIDTIWWIGNSENYNIIAYGYRKNLSAQGTYPSSDRLNNMLLAPSWARTKSDILNLITTVSVADSVNDDSIRTLDIGSNGDGINLGLTFLEAFDRGRKLEPRGVYEVLMRVDGTIDNQNMRHKPLRDYPTVFGSPVAVIRTWMPVPGRYRVLKHPELHDTFMLADWDGDDWKNIGWSTLGGEEGENPTTLPAPTQIHCTPELDSILSLNLGTSQPTPACSTQPDWSISCYMRIEGSLEFERVADGTYRLVRTSAKSGGEGV